MADFRVCATFVNATGFESNCSPEVTFTGITVGSPISMNLPTAPAGVTLVRVYSSLKDAPDGELFFVEEFTVPFVNPVEISSFDVDRDDVTPLIAPQDNFPPQRGFKFIDFWGGRIHLGNQRDTVTVPNVINPSRVSSSKDDNGGAFPKALINDRMDKEGGGENQGFIPGRDLIVLSDITTFVYPDDPTVRDFETRLKDVGILDFNTRIPADATGYWLSQRGLIRFTGFEAQRIDDLPTPFVPLVNEFKASIRKRAVRERNLLRWLYTDPVTPTRTKVIIYDFAREQGQRWLKDEYPFLIDNIIFNRSKFTAGTTVLNEGLLVTTGNALTQLDEGTTDRGATFNAVLETIAFTGDAAAYREVDWDDLLIDATMSSTTTVTADVTVIDDTFTQNLVLAPTGTDERQELPCRLDMGLVGRLLQIRITYDSGMVHGVYPRGMPRERSPL